MAARNKTEELLAQRSSQGLNDAVLLQDINETAFIQNLQIRFKNKFPYTYIGQTVISVNPYQQLDIYSDETIKSYRNVNFYEMPPHVFALADNSFRTMTTQNKSQCILISGESGSGKTEASKSILQFITNVKPSEQSRKIRDRLIKSNPLLEAFGNAKTNKNDNSSRFGKYMDVEFDYKGMVCGGHILNYLLEKARVIKQNNGERNFHIFYQLLAHPQLRLKYNLSEDSKAYDILGTGTIHKDDLSDFEDTLNAMKVSEFSEKEQDSLLQIIATILHLGNVGFEEENGIAHISKDAKTQEAVKNAANLLGHPIEKISKALTKKTIEAGGRHIETNLNKAAAEYARDALNKALYSKSFDWLVERLNQALKSQATARSIKGSSKNVIGLLDIYGFEIFEKNVFEQFCINYCNEKLQQLCVQLSLKQEQEEYKSEQIEWEPVDYFDNIPICKLIEQKPTGIIAILDEECRLPGDTSDQSFLSKMEDNFPHSQFFTSHKIMKNNADRKTIERGTQFRIRHYAGDVTYNVENFLERNNDAFYRDLKFAIVTSSNQIAQGFFTKEDIARKRLPETAATQFKTSLNNLMEILMSKEPSYVRCIKPNNYKSAQQFDNQLVSHQVKYLGLMENLRIRRAGFAYRRSYTEFLNRYKCLSTDTWPNYKGDIREGARSIMTAHGVDENKNYKLGRTKIFIRNPKTVFDLEEALEARKHELVTLITARWKGYVQRTYYKKLKEAEIILSKHYRGQLARKRAKARAKAATDLRKFIKGFIQRHAPVNEENRYFVQQVRLHYLLRCKKQLPTSVLKRENWPQAPANCVDLGTNLKKLWLRNWLRDYCLGMSDERKALLTEKLACSDLFKTTGRTDYEASVEIPFRSRRQETPAPPGTPGNIKYTCNFTKINGADLKPAKGVQQLFLGGDGSLHVSFKSKIKRIIPSDVITSITISKMRDQFLVVNVDPGHVTNKKAFNKSGVLIVLLAGEANIFEFLTKYKNVKPDLQIDFCETGQLEVTGPKGKPHTIIYESGSLPGHNLNKQKQLVITSTVI